MPDSGGKKTVRLTAQLSRFESAVVRSPPVPTHGELKDAVTVVAAVMVVTHVPVPVQPPPLQPANVEPPAGTAVSVTSVPWL